MIRIVLNDLFINLKNRWVQITIDTAFFIWVACYMAYCIVVDNNSKNMGKFNYDFIQGNLPEGVSAQIITVVSIIVILYLYSLMQNIPLRLSKPMFVCAAGEKEKIKFILLQLAIKIIFSFILIFTLSYLLCKSIFISNDLIINSIQIILWFFIILNINLKIGIGQSGVKKKDKDDYIIYTKEEEIVNIYWFCLLIIECIIFYFFANLNIKVNLLLLIVWIIAISLNIFISYKYIYPILKKSLSYEDIYCQVPERNEYY